MAAGCKISRLHCMHTFCLFSSSVSHLSVLMSEAESMSSSSSSSPPLPPIELRDRVLVPALLQLRWLLLLVSLLRLLLLLLLLASSGNFFFLACAEGDDVDAPLPMGMRWLWISSLILVLRLTAGREDEALFSSTLTDSNTDISLRSVATGGFLVADEDRRRARERVEIISSASETSEESVEERDSSS